MKETSVEVLFDLPPEFLLKAMMAFSRNSGGKSNMIFWLNQLELLFYFYCKPTPSYCYCNLLCLVDYRMDVLYSYILRLTYGEPCNAVGRERVIVSHIRCHCWSCLCLKIFRIELGHGFGFSSSIGNII